MLIGDKRTPKVRRSVVVSFAAPSISSVRRLVRTSLLQAARWNSRLDGLQSLSILGTAESAQLMTVNCLRLKKLQFASFLLKGLSKVYERSLQRSVSWYKKDQKGRIRHFSPGKFVDEIALAERLPEFSELEKKMLLGSSDFFGLTLVCTHIALFNLTPITLTVVVLFEIPAPPSIRKEQLQWELCKSTKAAIPGLT